MRAARAAPVLLLLVLGGCAAPGVRFHTMPAETPAADNAAAILKAAQAKADLEALARARAAQPAQTQAQAPVPVTPAEAPPMRTYDPWARLNRFTYRFNARFDRALFLPAANLYRRLPAPLQAGTHNFFANLGEIDNVVDYTLQGRLGRGVRSLGRLALNSTIGVGGLFDVARKVRLPPAPTSFSATLATWGMHPGAYLVLPVFGPSTLRDAVGLAADYAVLYGIDPLDLYRGPASWPLGLTNAVDLRANVAFRYYSTGSPFEYELVRFLYVRKRLIEDAGLHPTERPPKPAPDLPAGE